MRDCAVETCPPERVPLSFRSSDTRAAAPPENESDVADGTTPMAASLFYAGCAPGGGAAAASVVADDGPALGNVARAGRDEVAAWSEGSDVDTWIEQDEAAGMVYVDLLANPERFTGYKGGSPLRIWQAIYEENCFEDGGQCLEKRVFYRLLSGLQASISTHIARGYYYGGNYGAGGRWGLNTALFVERVGRHPDRLHNMYFTYLFVLRAIAKDRKSVV
jgi:hypothetical protein